MSEVTGILVNFAADLNLGHKMLHLTRNTAIHGDMLYPACRLAGPAHCRTDVEVLLELRRVAVVGLD